MLKQALVATAIVACVTPAMGSDKTSLRACYDQAATEYSVPSVLLEALASLESKGKADSIGWNRNGSYDYGLMQINSSWYRVLGKDRWSRLSDPCFNITTGAWILRRCIDQYGYNWKGIGCYHSRTPSKRDHYARQVAKLLPAIENQRTKEPTPASQGRKKVEVSPSVAWLLSE